MLPRHEPKWRLTRRDLELSYYFQTIALADRERSALNAGAAQRMLEQCPQELRGWEWNLLKRQGRSNQPPPLLHSSHLFSIAASPNGQWIIAGGVDGSVTLWDTTQLREPRRRNAHNDQVRGLAFSRDSRLYASAGWDGTVKVWATESGRCLHSWKIGKLAFGVAFGGLDGRQLAASNTTEILRWNLLTGEQIDTLRGHRDVVRRLTYSPDGKSLASVDDRGFVKVWNVATGIERLSFHAHSHLIFDIAYNQDGSRLVTAGGQFTMHGDSGEVKLWDVASGAKYREFRTNQGAFYAAALCPDGRRVVTGGEDAAVRVWDIASGQETLRLRGHTEAVWGLTFSPNSGRLYTASADHTVRVWDGTPVDADANPDLTTLDGHGDRVTSIAFSHDGLLLATASMDGTIRVWDAVKKLLLRDLSISSGKVQSVAFSPDSRRLASGVWRRWGDETESGMISIWDTQTWEEIERPHLDTVGVLGVVYSPSGRSLLAAADHAAVVLDVSTGEKLWSMPHSSLVTSVAFSQSDLLALADANGVVTVCAGSSGRVLRELPAHHGRVFCVAFSSDGRLLATAGADGAIHIWGTAEWGQLPSPRGHEGGTYGVAFAPDNRRLASGGNDGAVRIWDSLTGSELGFLSGHTDTIHAVAFEPDGYAIASGGRDKTVRIWNAVPKIESQPSIAKPHKED